MNNRLATTAVALQFNGNNPLPANTGTERFYVVTTSGPNATIGQLIWDHGTGVGSATLLASANRVILTEATFTGGTIALIADETYIWDNGAGAWQGYGVNVPLAFTGVGPNTIEGLTDQEQLQIYTVDGAAVDLVTLRMQHPATVTGSLGTFNPLTGETVTLGYDNAPDFVTTFNVSDNTANLDIARINAAAGFVFASYAGGQIKLTSVQQGSSRGQVRVVGGTPGTLTKLGLTVGVTLGTNTVISDLTSTGAIEANAISFQNGLQQKGGGGVVGEFAGGALVLTCGPQGSGNVVAQPQAAGAFYVQPGAVTTNQILIDATGITLKNAKDLIWFDAGGTPRTCMRLDSGNILDFVGGGGGGFTWRTQAFGTILLQLFNTGQLWLKDSATSGPIAGGGFFYSVSGILNWKESGGNVVVLNKPFELDLTLIGGTKTVASGKDLTNATLIGIKLKTPNTAVGQPVATFVAGANGNVTVTSYGPAATQLIADVSTYTCVFAGAV